MQSVDERLTALAAAHGFNTPPAHMNDDDRRAFCVALSTSVTLTPDFTDWWTNGVEVRARERAAAAWRRECEERAAAAAAPPPPAAEPAAPPPPSPPPASSDDAARTSIGTPAPEVVDAWQTVRVVDGEPAPCVRPAGGDYSLSYVRTQVSRAAAKVAAAAAAARDKEANGGAATSPPPLPRAGRPGAPLLAWMSVRRGRDGLWLPIGEGPIEPGQLEWLPERGDRDAARAAARAGGAASSSYGPPPPPHVTAALRASLVDAVLGGRAARAFCARVVGRAVERAVDDTKG